MMLDSWCVDFVVVLIMIERKESEVVKEENLAIVPSATIGATFLLVDADPIVDRLHLPMNCFHYDGCVDLW